MSSRVGVRTNLCLLPAVPRCLLRPRTVRIITKRAQRQNDVRGAVTACVRYIETVRALHSLQDLLSIEVGEKGKLCHNPLKRRAYSGVLICLS